MCWGRHNVNRMLTWANLQYVASATANTAQQWNKKNDGKKKNFIWSHMCTCNIQFFFLLHHRGSVTYFTHNRIHDRRVLPFKMQCCTKLKATTRRPHQGKRISIRSTGRCDIIGVSTKIPTKWRKHYCAWTAAPLTSCFKFATKQEGKKNTEWFFLE